MRESRSQVDSLPLRLYGCTYVPCCYSILTPHNVITVRGATSRGNAQSLVTLDGSVCRGSALRIARSASGFRLVGVDVELLRATSVGVARAAFAHAVTVEARDCSLARCVLASGGGAALALASSGSATLSHCRVRAPTTGAGFFVVGAAATITLSHCAVEGCAGAGIEARGGARVVALDSEVRSCGRCAVYAHGGARVTLLRFVALHSAWSAVEGGFSFFPRIYDPSQ